VIGGGDWAEDRLIPDCVRALATNEPIPVRNPDAVRPWQHVLEPLAGYLSLAAAQWSDPAAFAGAFNFGPLPAGNLNVGRVVDLVVKCWGAGCWERTAPPAGHGGMHEASVLRLDVTKAATLLDWAPRMTAEETIRQTVGWYRRRHDGGSTFDAHAGCRAEIVRYMHAIPY
jgi:CDP-glucose 4,6-dehydratase